jgi:hypothetical protein
VNREDYRNALRLLAKWSRKRTLAETKIAYYMNRAQRFERETVRETNYRVWKPIHRGKTHHRDIYVIEIDEGEMCKRICKNQSVKVGSYKDSLVARYWKLATKINYSGKGVSKGHKVEREAYDLIRRLKEGEKIKPDYEKPGPLLFKVSYKEIADDERA